MKESYLKHLTVAVIGTGLVMVVLFSPDLALRHGAMTLLGVVIGYVFKNGTAAKGPPT